MSATRIPETLALLREKGWCKGAMSRDGMHCIIGAGFRAHGINLEGDIIPLGCVEDELAIRDVLQAQYDQRSIAYFNDAEGTTFEMVEAVLEKAALERGGSL